MSDCNCENDCNCQTYGPGPKSDMTFLRGMKIASKNAARRQGFGQLVEMFNAHKDASTRIGILSANTFVPNPALEVPFLWTPGAITFSEIGIAYRDKRIGAINERFKKDAPLHFSFQGEDVVIFKLINDGNYETLTALSILSLTLALLEESSENGRINFIFQMKYDPGYGSRASAESSAL